MKKFIIVVVILLAVILIAYRTKVVIEQTRLEDTQTEERITPVEIQLVEKGSLKLSLNFIGDVKGKEEVDIFPKASGKLVELKVKEGDQVKKDQVVALVDRDIDGIKFELLQVTSPMDGIVGMVYLDEGAQVTPPSPAPSMGTQIIRVVNMDQIKVVVNATEEDMGKVKKGQEAAIRVDTYPDDIFSGKLTLVSPLVNPLTRTASVEIELPNPKHFLKPGMFARVQVSLGKKENVILIPTHAIVEETGQKKVFLIQDGKAISRMVESGTTQDGLIEIKTGLAEGDSLIVAGQYLVKENEPVKVVSAKGGES